MSEGRVSIPATTGEAFSLFDAWRVDRALIRIEFRLRILAATFLARVSAVGDATVHFMADDKWAELVLPIPGRDVSFRFMDINEFANRAKFERLLVMFYNSSEDLSGVDQIVFAEVDESTVHDG